MNLKRRVISWSVRNKGEAIAFLITAAASLSVFLFSALRFPNDDQFILYRYIDHIAAGDGFVYNIGEKVLGSTTPLFTLIASLIKWLFLWVPTPDLVAYLNIFFLSCAAWYFYRLAHRFLPLWLAIVSVLIFALNLARTIPEGMETPLFLFLLLGFLSMLLEGRHKTAAVFLALSVLTRPDAGLIAVLAGVYWLTTVGFRKTAILTALTVAVATPWLVFSTLYFGSFVPQSLQTKLHSDIIYSIPHFQALKVQLASISRILWGRIYDPDNLALQAVFNLFPLFVLALVGAWKTIRNRAWILCVIPIVYLISFSLSNPIIFPWYLSEMEPLWILLVCIGVASLIKYLPKRPFWGVIVAALLIGPLAGWYTLATTKDEGSKQEFFQIAQFIKEHARPTDSVGIADIGIVGYVTNRPLIDFIGLVSPDSVAYYPVPASCVRPGELYTIPGELIQTTKPNWVVVSGNQLDTCLAGAEWWTTTYVLVEDTGTKEVWQLRDRE